jgi:hypothetical protein
MVVWLIITSCIHNKFGIKNSKTRQAEYTTAIQAVQKYVPSEIQIRIVENSSESPTFLDSFGIPVIYTRHSNINVINKGIIEFKDLLYTLHTQGANPDDIVIKLTGRYSILNSLFFERVLQTQTEYDAWVKFYNVCTYEFMENDCVLGLFAIRYKYLKNLDYSNLGYKNSMEVDFATFINKECSRIDKIYDLGLHCIFGDNGHTTTC